MPGKAIKRLSHGLVRGRGCGDGPRRGRGSRTRRARSARGGTARGGPGRGGGGGRLPPTGRRGVHLAPRGGAPSRRRERPRAAPRPRREGGTAKVARGP